MSDTPRTDAIYPVELLDRGIEEHGRTWGWGIVSDFRDLARQLERELNEAKHRIRTLIEQRDGFRIQADHKWRLREEFEALLGTSDVATGVERVKQLKHALSLVVPKCDYLDHPKKCQHQITEPCPVEELIRKAQNP